MYASLGLFLMSAIPAFAATAAQWRSRSIYQVMTDRFARTDQSTTASCSTASQVYCGGTWLGLVDKLDYIQGMGFTAIWISPVTAQLTQNTTDGEAYHGYWQQNLFTLNPNFGSASDLQALSAAVHARGMYLMVDVVVNHFGWAGAANTVVYSDFSPFNSGSFFHSYCPVTDYDYSSNLTAVQDCWLGDNTVALADVDTTQSFVISTYYAWIKSLASTYFIDGLRIDTVEQVQQGFWPGFNTAAGVYCVGEIYNGDPAFTCPYQNYLDGVLNYPLYYPLTRAFQSTSGNIAALASEVLSIKSDCKDPTLLGTFLENHDNPRFPSLTSDLSLAKNAIAFAMLADGIPIVYQGQEQHYGGGPVPANREAAWLSGYSNSSVLYTFIASVNQIRNQAIYKDATYLTYKAYPIYTDASTIVMRKGSANGQIIGVFSNMGASGSSYTLILGNTGFYPGQQVVEILACVSVTTDSNGNIAVSMANGLPRIFYPAAGLRGTGICEY